MRNLAFVVMLALLALAVPAISQGNEKKSLEDRVVELIERVDELEKQNAELEVRLKKEEEWTKRQDARNARAAKLASYAMKKGYFYPAPANDAKGAILNAFATLDGQSIKIPKNPTVPPTPGVDPFPPEVK
ncbi:MAG: hypothetical protein ACYTGN_16880 [Planctomycetota bacterium]|jgi:hypothetical protein